MVQTCVRCGAVTEETMIYRFRDVSAAEEGKCLTFDFDLDEGNLQLELGREGVINLAALLQVLAATDEGLAEEIQEAALEIARDNAPAGDPEI